VTAVLGGWSVGALIARLRDLRHRGDGEGQWCPGTGVQVSTGASNHGMTWCPYCPNQVPTETAPMARYRIIGEHTP
jgi:hypothetical protein